MIKTLNPRNILMYGKKGRNFFDKYIECGIPVTFYDPPNFHEVIFRKVTKLDI